MAGEWGAAVREREPLVCRLAPLVDYGFDFSVDGEDVWATVERQTRRIPVRELMDSNDPCRVVAERFEI